MYLPTDQGPSRLLETICAKPGSKSPSVGRSLGEDGTGLGGIRGGIESDGEWQYSTAYTTFPGTDARGGRRG